MRGLSRLIKKQWQIMSTTVQVSLTHCELLLLLFFLSYPFFVLLPCLSQFLTKLQYANLLYVPYNRSFSDVRKFTSCTDSCKNLLHNFIISLNNECSIRSASLLLQLQPVTAAIADDDPLVDEKCESGKSTVSC